MSHHHSSQKQHDDIRITGNKGTRNRTEVETCDFAFIGLRAFRLDRGRLAEVHMHRLGLGVRIYGVRAEFSTDARALVASKAYT